MSIIFQESAMHSKSFDAYTITSCSIMDESSLESAVFTLGNSL